MNSQLLFAVCIHIPRSCRQRSGCSHHPGALFTLSTLTASLRHPSLTAEHLFQFITGLHLSGFNYQLGFFFNGVLWLKLCKEEKKIPLPQLCSGEYMLYLMTSDNQVKNTMIVTGDVYRSDSDLGLFGLWLARGHHTGGNVSLVMNITQEMCYVWGPFFQCHRDSFTNLQDK